MKPGESIWICGKVTAQTAKGVVWEFQGAFATKAEAARACRSRQYFIGPAVLGAALPDETVDWPGCEFPLEAS